VKTGIYKSIEIKTFWIPAFAGMTKNSISQQSQKEQTATSKKELKSIYYVTVDKVAQVNIILGLINWNDPLEDKDEDMVEWCEQGARIADILKEKWLRAIFLSYKGIFLSLIWSREDMQTAFTIKAGNTIGIPSKKRENAIKI